MRTFQAVAAFFPLLAGADFKDVNPNVFPPDDPRARELPRMMQNDAKRRMQEACLRESRAFAAVQTREQWEAYRDVRIKALRESLGEFPPPPQNMRIVVTRKLDGDGFIIHNLVYETRPGLWANANLYLPTNPPAKMPGIIISHSHHTPNTQGELQDMGMTWARSGCAVLVPEHLGHGERRQHRFVTEKDYPKPFRPSRQDYYFRYNSAIQLSLVGESLMGWMVWDLMRGVDVLLRQPNIDPARIIMLGAVAGGGDPAGVAAALDPRIACVVPFNFSGWQPESNAPPDPDRDFAWFGEGYWETTRGLRNGARDGFAHYVITGSIAPRRLIYAHEFRWDPNVDPAWPRLQKIYGFYDAKDRLSFAHGAGKVTGQAGPDNTHCTHIGAVHRKMIYPALKAWFDMPIPEEYSKRRPAEELTCWTDAARAELKPKLLHGVLAGPAEDRAEAARMRVGSLVPVERTTALRKEWARLLCNVEPLANPKLIEGQSEEVPGGKLTRFALEVEPGIVIPFLLITPSDAKGKRPVVVMIAQPGKAAFLKQRGDVIAAFLKAGVAVCLADVRGTGETQPGDGSPGRTGSRTSISQTNLILGQPLLGSQLRDLRAVVRWLQERTDLDGNRLAVWGDSFAPPNPPETDLAVPLDAPELPRYAEPGAARLAHLAGLFEDGIRAVEVRGSVGGGFPFASPYVYVPHDAVVPGQLVAADFGPEFLRRPQAEWFELTVNGRNQLIDPPGPPPAVAVPWVVEKLNGK
jgi:cephalosporin-C deacetylase-like acetyl esterase